MRPEAKYIRIVHREVSRVVPRRYNFTRRIAVEVFTFRGKSYLFNFVREEGLRSFLASYEEKKYVARERIWSEQKLLERKERLVELWKQGLLDNFSLLAHLNNFASRSYNDLSQYPVFPFVLDDYESDSLNLDKEDSYRPLHLPVGALDPGKFRKNEERYRQSKKDGDLLSYMYGCHYSTAGYVSYYLVRIEPFASLAQELQGGNFDKADRLFSSLEALWRNIKRSPADFK